MSLRLAMLAPTPPAPTGVADYVRDLTGVLPVAWRVDLFDETRDETHEEDAPASAGESGEAADAGEMVGAAVAGIDRARVYPLRAWEARHAAEPYDLVVHHVGNGPCHAATVAHARRHPGLLVLHDAVLHPSRVATGFADYDLSGYRAVANDCRPDVGEALASLVAGGVASPQLYWTFPLCEDLIRASLGTVVHGELLAAWVRALVPDGRIDSVAHWRAVPEAEPARVARWRERLGAVGGERVVVGAFGHLGAAHRAELVVRAIEQLGERDDFRVVLVGAADEPLRARVARSSAAARIELTGRVDDADFGALLRAVDIGVNLRYPTARASSGPLQQLLQLGVPCVIQDLVHLRDIPAGAVARVPTAPAERESDALRDALRGWLDDSQARREAGAAAFEWAARTITPEAMAKSYERAVEGALGRA